MVTHSIYNWTDLAAIGVDPEFGLNDDYILMNNLTSEDEDYEEEAGTNANEDKGWAMIGGSTTSGGSFGGKFDGQGHTISDLYIHRPTENYIGFIGVAQGAEISNLGIIDCNVIGNMHVGGLIGMNYSLSEISNSYSTGTVEGNDCYIGGLIGSNHSYSEVLNSYSTGTVEGNGYYIGGLIGRNYSFSEIFDSYSACTVKGSSYIGGLIGENSLSEIFDSYSTGTVEGSNYIGGLIGGNTFSEVFNSYSTGTVEGSNYIGGLVGSSHASTVENSFWNTNACDDSDGGTVKTSAQMKNIETFTDEETDGLDSAWDFIGNPNDDNANEDIWNMTYGYPYIQKFYGSRDALFNNEKASIDVNKYIYLDVSENEDATIIINNKDYKVGDVGGNFVWDIDGENEHTFYNIRDNFVFEDGNVVISVIYQEEGSQKEGSQKFDIKIRYFDENDINRKDYYEMVEGISSYENDKWIIDSDKNKSLKLYADKDIIDDVNEEMIVSPSEIKTNSINKFSDKLNIDLNNTDIIKYNDNNEFIELKLDDRIISIVLDESGSMTWNDNDGFRYQLIKDLITKINNYYPGNVKYNLFTYGGVPVNSFIFALTEDEHDSVSDISTLGSLYYNKENNVAGVRVIRNKDRYPESPIDGTIISDGLFNSIFDDNLEKGVTYYYKIFTYNENYKFSKGVEISVVPNEKVLPAGINLLYNYIEDDKDVLIGQGVRKDDNTIAIWHFNENKGNYAFDFSGNSLNLNLNDILWIEPSFIPINNGGIWLNGNNSDISLSDENGNLSINSTNNEITIMGYIYPYLLEGKQGLLIRQNNNFINYYISLNNNALEFGFVDNNSSQSENILSEELLEENVWQHFVVTYDCLNGEVNFYINGDSAGNGSVEIPSWTDNDIHNMNFNIGASFLDNDGYRGKITNFSIHNVIRNINYINDYISRDSNNNLINNVDDNGDRLAVIKFIIPQDINYNNCEAIVVRKRGEEPSWHGDGKMIKTFSDIEEGIYFFADNYDFVNGDNYYYKIFVKNNINNYNYITNSSLVDINIPYIANNDDKNILPDISISAPEEPLNGDLITNGNKKIYLKWKNNLNLNDERVRIYYSTEGYPTLYNMVGNGELIYSGKSDKNFFVHRNIYNGQEYYYSIVNVDRYGRFSDELKIKGVPKKDIDESSIPLPDIKSINYNLVDENSIALNWKEFEGQTRNSYETYFDETVYIYAYIADIYGNPIEDSNTINIEIIPTIERGEEIEDVFDEGGQLDFNVSDTYSFNATRHDNGLIVGELNMVQDARILSQIDKGSFDIKIKSCIPSSSVSSTNGEEDGSDIDSLINETIETIELIATLAGEEQEDSLEDDSKITEEENVFEYISHSITIDFYNPWDINLFNRDNKAVSKECYYYYDDEWGITHLGIDDRGAHGVYIGATNPFIARARITYKGEPVTSGTIMTSIFDATKDLCKCAGSESDSCSNVGEKIKKSDTVFADEEFEIQTRYEQIENEDGELVEQQFSYVDIPIYSPDVSQAIFLFVKGQRAGYNSLDKLYVVFENVLKIDLIAGGPTPDGEEIAEQQALVYKVDPDYPNDKTKHEYVDDHTIAQWSCNPLSRIEYFGLTQASIGEIYRDVYSLDNVPLSNGTYSYTRDGVARNVYVGPISPIIGRSIKEVHEIEVSITYEGNTVSAKGMFIVRFNSEGKHKLFDNGRFLIELEYWYHEPYQNRIWSDGKEYIKGYIIKNPNISDTLHSNIFRTCADNNDISLIELSDEQVIHISTGYIGDKLYWMPPYNYAEPDERVSILYGEVFESIDEYTGEKYLETNDNTFIDKGEAYITLDKDSNITPFYIKVNRFISEPIDLEYVGEIVEINLDCLDLFSRDICGHFCISGMATINIDGEPRELVGGGNMYSGLPPCPVWLREPLNVRIISEKVNGEEVEISRMLLDIIEGEEVLSKEYDTIWVSLYDEIDIKVQVSFAGNPVPEDTPIYADIISIRYGNIPENLFYTRSPVATYIGDDGSSYADIRLVSRTVGITTGGGATEKLEIRCHYDESELIDRDVNLSVFIYIRGEEDDEPEPPDEDPSLVEPEPPGITEPLSVYSDIVYKYNLNDGEWIEVENLTEGKGDFFNASVDNKIYVMGGLINGIGDIRSISDISESFNPINSEWVEFEKMPHGRFGGMTVVYDNLIYCMGGVYCNVENNMEVSKCVEAYDIDSKEWKIFSNMPHGVAFGTAQKVDIDEKYIYILNGISGIDDKGNPYEYNNKILRYSILDDSWEDISIDDNHELLSRYKRLSPLSFNYDDSILVMGGMYKGEDDYKNYNNNIINISLSNDISETIITDGFKYFNNIININYGSSISVLNDDTSLNNNYYITGGIKYYSINNDMIRTPIDVLGLIDMNNDLYQYQDSNDNPSMLSSMPIAKYGHGSSIVLEEDENHYLYVMGGYTDGLQNNEVVIETFYNDNIKRCLLDGQQSSTIPIFIKKNGELINKDVNIIVEGYIEFSNFDAEQENDIMPIYPVLFKEREIEVINGQAEITLLPRSEDIFEDTESIIKNIYGDNKSDIAIPESQIVEEDEEGVTSIIIKTGDIREPYQIVVKINVIDDYYYGETKVSISDDDIDIDTDGLIDHKAVVKTFHPIVKYYSDIEWVPIINSIFSEYEDNYNIIIDEIKKIENSISFGASPLYDAIQQASNNLISNEYEDTRKLFYVYTDNESNISVNSIDNIIDNINNIDGQKQVPVLVGNMNIVYPRTLSVQSNASDTYDINKLSYLTGGQSVTINSSNLIDETVSIFYTEASGSMGYGEASFIVDMEKEVLLNNISANFFLPNEEVNASWKISLGSDLNNLTIIEKDYTPYDVVDLTEYKIRYIKFDIVLITGLDEDNKEYINSLEKPSLQFLIINYNDPNICYLYSDLKEKDILPYQMIFSVNSNNISNSIIEVGVTKSDSNEWKWYRYPSQPSIVENGKIIIPLRFFEEIKDDTIGEIKEKLNKIDRYTLKCSYGRWEADSMVIIYDKNNNMISSDNYVLYPDDGYIVFSYSLESYVNGDYTMNIIHNNNYKIGLKIINNNPDDELKISGISYMYNTNKNLLPPIESIPPEVNNLEIIPTNASRYSKISLFYDYYDANYEKENIDKREIKWYINNIHVEYLDGLVEWNDVSNSSDPIWKEAFNFEIQDLDEQETVVEKARKEDESIVTAGDSIYCTIKVSDGTFESIIYKSNIIIIAESPPVVYNASLVGINVQGQIINELYGGSDAEVKFDFYSDGGSNLSEITWWVNNDIFKKGIYDTENENGVLYQRLVPAEYGINTTLDIALKMYNEIYAQITPKTDVSTGDSVNTNSMIVHNTPPVVDDVGIVPEEPTENNDLIVSWKFYDFEIQASYDTNSSYQENLTSIQWWRKEGGKEWEKVYDNSEELTEVFVLEGFEDMVNDSNIRTSSNLSVLDSSAINSGEAWKVIVIPYDSIDTGISVESNIVNIQ